MQQQISFKDAKGEQAEEGEQIDMTPQGKAQRFLEQTATRFSVKFLHYGKYFDDDKESCDIYEITLTRGKRKFTFTFGQSIAKSGKYILYYTNQRFERGYRFQESELKTIRAAFIGFGFGRVYERNEDYAIPTAYDVLSCLQKNEVGTLEEFCREFGYDTDSRKAEKIYSAVCHEWQEIKALYNDEEIERLQEIS